MLILNATALMLLCYGLSCKGHPMTNDYSKDAFTISLSLPYSTRVDFTRTTVTQPSISAQSHLILVPTK